MRLLGWLVLLGSIPLAGCYAPTPWSNPGPAPLQQGRAVKFDPYPDPIAGPPVVGGRPLGYLEPQPETVQAQQWQPPHVLR